MGYGITAFRTDFKALQRFFGRCNKAELKAVLRQRKAIRELDELFDVGADDAEHMSVVDAVRELSMGRVTKNPTAMHAYGVQLVARRYGAQLASGVWERISVRFFSHFDDLLTEHGGLTGGDRLHKALASGLDFAMKYQAGFPEWGHYPPTKVRMLHRQLKDVSFADDRDEYQQIALVDFRRWVRTASRHGHALLMYYD